MTGKSAISEVVKKVIILTQRYVPIRVQKQQSRATQDLYICANVQLYHYYSKGEKKQNSRDHHFFLKNPA